MVKNDDLSRRLKALGFPLFEEEGASDANLTLAEMARSGQMRLWEGFPVVLANSGARGLLDYDAAAKYLKTADERFCFASLVAMSLALYKAAGARFSWTDALYGRLAANKRKESDALFNALKHNAEFKLCGRLLSAERLMKVFSNYYTQAGRGLGDLLQAKEELGLEYAMSQVFSPKQRDLFLKKLRGETFTKTEKEYYSRVVRKKVQALANPELYRLSQKLLQ